MYIQELPGCSALCRWSTVLVGGNVIRYRKLSVVVSVVVVGCLAGVRSRFINGTHTHTMHPVDGGVVLSTAVLVLDARDSMFKPVK